MKKLIFLFLFLLIGTDRVFAISEAEITDKLMSLYIATFDRAPDISGLNYWKEEIVSGRMTIERVAESFFDQPETKNRYPNSMDIGKFINSIYLNVLGREPDSAGKNYWSGELISGQVKKQNFILAIINGAKGDDVTYLNNKKEIGEYFTTQLKSDDTTLAQDIMKNITTNPNSVTEVKTKLQNCLKSNKNYIKKGSIGGVININNTTTLKRKMTSMEGGLWLTPQSIEVAKKMANRSLNCQLPYNQTKPIPILVKKAKALDGVKTFFQDNIPTGLYDLIYIDENNQGIKIDNIQIKAGEKTTQNITQEKPNGSLKLVVQSLATNQKLANAEVRLNELDKTIITDKDGIAEFKNLPEGSYSVTISCNGYVSKYKAFNIISNKKTDLQAIELNSEKGEAKGKVVVEGVTNYANVIVYAKDREGSIFTTLTTPSGDYTFSALPIGEGYSIIAYTHDFGVGKVENVTIEKDKITKVDTITLKKAPATVGSISGYAKFENSDKKDFAGIMVSIEKKDKEAVTARDGFFVLNNVPKGTYKINFTYANYLTVTKEVKVVEGANTYLGEVKLQSATGGVKMKVVDEVGNPVHRALVYIKDKSATFITDKEGITSLVNIPIGNWVMIVGKDGYSDVSKMINITSTTEDLTDKPIKLTKTSINGKVSIEGGLTTTKSRNITLKIESSTAKKMKISEDIDFRDATLVDYSPTYNYTLSDGLGEKTIYVALYDLTDNELKKKVVFTTIKLISDGTSPVESKTYNLQNINFQNYTLYSENLYTSLNNDIWSLYIKTEVQDYNYNGEIIKLVYNTTILKDETQGVTSTSYTIDYYTLDGILFRSEDYDTGNYCVVVNNPTPMSATAKIGDSGFLDMQCYDGTFSKSSWILVTDEEGVAYKIIRKEYNGYGYLTNMNEEYYYINQEGVIQKVKATFYLSSGITLTLPLTKINLN